jgi:hypothetical protein
VIDKVIAVSDILNILASAPSAAYSAITAEQYTFKGYGTINYDD